MTAILVATLPSAAQKIFETVYPRFFEHYRTTDSFRIVSGKLNHSINVDASGDNSQLIENQYKGKENLRPFYEALMAEILKIGPDIEVAPKNSSVSLRRKKQFCLLEPKTKTRLEVGLNMKNVEAAGKLEACPPGGMCSHKIRIEKTEDIDHEVFEWIRTAYGQAG
jgi:predicted transport protein